MWTLIFIITYYYFTLDIAIKEESTILATATLEWQKPSLNTGKATNYIVLYKLSQPSNYWNVARANNTQVSLRNIQPESEYTVRVLVLTTSNITYESQTFTLKTGIGTSMHTFILRKKFRHWFHEKWGADDWHPFEGKPFTWSWKPEHDDVTKRDKLARGKLIYAGRIWTGLFDRWITLSTYPVDSAVCFVETYALDSDLFCG